MKNQKSKLHAMETMEMSWDLGLAPAQPESLFESDQLAFGHENNNSLAGELFTDFELYLSSESMNSFLELEQIQEVAAATPTPAAAVRTSVIVSKNTICKPTTSKLTNVKPELKTQHSLTDIIASCGISSDWDAAATAASPSSCGSSDLELERNQELIEELEDFFIKVDGKATVVDETPVPAPTPNTVLSAMLAGKVEDWTQPKEELTMEHLEAAYTTNFVTQDGQSVVIIIAPDSPADTKLCVKEEPQATLLSLTPSPRPDPDPEWSPGASPAPGPDRPRKKYARTNPPRPPTGPYPTEKKERKKAQNRTAAFRYREKKKSEQDTIDDELELLGRRNVVLKEKLTEMEMECKLLKKLMTEAGLGCYTKAMSI